MSPKKRFPVMLEPEQLEGLLAIERATGATRSEQIRRALNEWIMKEAHRLRAPHLSESQRVARREALGRHMKSDRKRVGARKRA
jgi:hypothetical protein